MTTYAELAQMRDRLLAEPAPSETELAELAAALPSSVQGRQEWPERPESALLLAELYERLWRYRHAESRWPDWRRRTAELPMRVRIAWLRAEVLNEPAVLRTEPRAELLYQTLRQIPITSARRPDHLVAELSDSPDPVLQREALRLAREGLYAACLSPALVRKQVVGLLESGDDNVVVSALDLLAEPWAALEPLPAGLLSRHLLSGRLVVPGHLVSDAALAAAARHGHQDTLWNVVEDPALPSSLRRRAMQMLGDLAARTDISNLITLAAQDPLLFGTPVLDCLRGLHRRGHFLDEPDVPALLGIALADHTTAAQDTATILFTNRHAAFQQLTAAPADDPTWPRRLGLLIALDGQARGEVPVGEAITRILPHAPQPEPFLAAIRTLRYVDAEDTVIAALPTAPAAALRTLEAIGARRTVAVLRAGLGLGSGSGFELASAEDAGAGSEGGGGESDGPAGIAPHLRPHRNQALEILWHLTRDLGQRHALLDRLDPADLPPRIAADLGGPDERELVLLRSHLDPDKPVAGLCRLAASGGVGTVPVITDILMRIVAELAASAAGWSSTAAREPGATGWRLDSEPQTGEPVVPQEVVDAVRDMGRRLHARKKIRPSCLLDAPTPQAAGNALVASMALDLLDRPGISAAEQAILLELLVRVPSPQTRPRIPRLLRSPDQHVRKHAIRLLIGDGIGNDVQALSATLIKLTSAEDAPTVRQALLALGQAEARWAAAAIAACLDHPTMNIKKTAAEALVLAGTPEAVPKCLFWLGHHDNPGFRSSLMDALHAILGTAYAATLLAAAENEAATEAAADAVAEVATVGDRDDRTRRLLLGGLDGELSVSSVLALEEQGSPVAPTLLVLVAAGEVSLASGQLASGPIDTLTSAFARHAIEQPARERPQPSADADRAVRALLAAVWDPAIALRIAEAPVPPSSPWLRRLRPMLTDWLRLADREPAVRARLPRLFPAPWSDEDLACFARCAPVLRDGLTQADPGDLHDIRDSDDSSDGGWFIAVLTAVAPRLPAVEKLAVVDVVRALKPATSAATASAAPATAAESTVTLLRACDAVLLPADIGQALAAARLRPDPARAEAAVLREAFTATTSQSASQRTSEGPARAIADSWAASWRVDLVAAVRTRATLEAFRGRTDAVPALQDRLDALIDVFASAGVQVRADLLDWMLAIQPLDVPSWTVAELARVPIPIPVPAPRIARADDLDQPRSAALRERLLAMLAAPDRERRDSAARILWTWPEPDIRFALLRPYLRGEIDLGADVVLASAVRTLSEAELRADGIRPDRVLIAAGELRPEDTEVLVPLLLDWWQQGPPVVRQQVRHFLRRADGDLLAEVLSSRLEAREWGFVELLSGRPLLRTPLLTELCERLRSEGEEALADSILLTDGPLRGLDAKQQDVAALTVLRDHAQVPKASHGTSRAELIDLARSGQPDQIRRALLRLGEMPIVDKTSQGPAPEDPHVLQELLAELLTHPKPKVRLQAHRTARRLLDRDAYLRHTSILLTDPQPDVLRMAIRTLSYAGWEPAIPAMVALLEHPHPTVRAEAASGLVRIGTPAVPALRRAAGHARPDKRAGYTAVLEAVLERIAAADNGVPGQR
ncbi:HEAT repeat domain-containing protein [Catenulispora pinisilvae]|uniref:HEAT repeat domain-containing protein n=1 Tax=Catenulispora pinisilvae TaxID=2705253 RepID=UPI00189206D3|nr:HEAT repeat domain-containing protein [Catenulispora pinisilvae]